MDMEDLKTVDVAAVTEAAVTEEEGVLEMEHQTMKEEVPVKQTSAEPERQE
jgi:hypothetical protein